MPILLLIINYIISLQKTVENSKYYTNEKRFYVVIVLVYSYDWMFFYSVQYDV